MLLDVSINYLHLLLYQFEIKVCPIYNVTFKTLTDQLC